MKIFRSKISKNLSNYAYLFSANFGILPLTLAANILLASELGPQEFGNYSYLLSLIIFLTTICSFGFYQAAGRAIVLSINNSKTRQYYGATILITVVLYLILAIFLSLYFIFDVNIYDKGLKSFYLLVIFSGWILLFRRYCDVLFQSDKKIKLLALSKFIQPIVFLLGLSVIYFYQVNLYRTLQIFIASHVLSATIVIYFLRPSFKSLGDRIFDIWNFNKEFGIHLYLGSILPLSMTSLAAIIVSYNSHNNAGVGYYTLALSFVALVPMIPNTIATVMFRDFSKMKSIPFEVALSAFTLGLLGLLILAISIKPFILIFYGESYKPVAYLVYIMMFGFLAHGMGDVLNRFLLANGQGEMIRNCGIIIGSFSFCANLFLIPKFYETGAAIAISISGFTYLTIMAIYYIQFKANIKRT